MIGFKKLKLNSVDNSNTLYPCYSNVYNYLKDKSLDNIYVVDNDEISKISKSLGNTPGTVDSAICYLVKTKYLDVIERYIPKRNKLYEGFNPGTREYGYVTNIINKYNTTPKVVLDLHKLQEGKCAICNKTEKEVSSRLHVDHCHKTGKIRGLLCGNCNKGIGMLLENTEILESAIEYIKKNN